MKRKLALIMAMLTLTGVAVFAAEPQMDPVLKQLMDKNAKSNLPPETTSSVSVPKMNADSVQVPPETAVESVEEELEEVQEVTPMTHDFDKDTIYYPNASVKSAVSKYKARNYTGCIQELLSFVKKNPSDAAAYYYLALAYAQISDSTNAVEAYDKAIALNTNPIITEYSRKGKDCLTNGPLCQYSSDVPVEQTSELDAFINAPYGNGMSPEINAQVRQKQLENIQKTINKKNELERKDIEKIERFDNGVIDSSSSAETGEKLAYVSDEEVLGAIKTLREAGLTVNVQPQNSYYQNPEYMTQNQEMMQLSAMLGNNNRNGNSSMDMIPYLMNSDGTPKKNINPQMIQTMLLNSSMMDFDFNSGNND